MVIVFEEMISSFSEEKTTEGNLALLWLNPFKEMEKGILVEKRQNTNYISKPYDYIVEQRQTTLVNRSKEMTGMYIFHANNHDYVLYNSSSRGKEEIVGGFVKNKYLDYQSYYVKLNENTNKPVRQNMFERKKYSNFALFGYISSAIYKPSSNELMLLKSENKKQVKLVWMKAD